MARTSARPKPGARVPPELVNILGTSAAIFAVVSIGSAIAAVLPEPTPQWLFASAYLAPASIAFVAYWWIAQKL